MVAIGKKRVFITLDVDLVEYLDKKAWSKKMTKSQLVEMLLKELEKNDNRKSK